MSASLEWDNTNSAPPNADNPFREGDWATWANLIKGVHPGPFLIIDSSTDRVRIVDPNYLSTEEGTWRPVSLFQKYDPKKHLKFLIEYCSIVEGRHTHVM